MENAQGFNNNCKLFTPVVLRHVVYKETLGSFMLESTVVRQVAQRSRGAEYAPALRGKSRASPLSPVPPGGMANWGIKDCCYILCA